MLIRMKSQQNPWQEILVLLGATFLMGSSFVAGKVLLRTVPPLALVGWRFLLAAVFTAALITLRPAQRLQVCNEFRAITVRDWAIITLIGGLQTTAVMGLLTSTALNLLVLPTLALRYGRFKPWTSSCDHPDNMCLT